MTREELKKAAVRAIEDNKDRLIEAGEYFYNNPETGFQEVKTSAYFKKMLEEIGVICKDGIAVTGVKGSVDGRNNDFNLAFMGELDALNMPTHPHCDKTTGKFHGCGHNAQLCTVLGAAIGLVSSGIYKELDGKLTFIGVPAEEIIEQDFRMKLRDEGKIGLLGGKQEFIRLGMFDDVDAVLASHILGGGTHEHFWLGHSWNGVIFKNVRFTGKPAHAGLAPHEGINALEAALCALNNVNALRESFCDDDHVRIHYIITKGGSSCNIVPDDVRLEFGVRAATLKSLRDANEKVNRALRLGAEAIGAGLEIHDSGLDLPCHQNRALAEIYLSNARELLGDDKVDNVFGTYRGSSTDCGDVASLIPLISPYFGGATGKPHANDFDIIDPYAAYVVPAEAAAMTAIDLLFDGASAAKQLKADFVPDFRNKDEYTALTSSLLTE